MEQQLGFNDERKQLVLYGGMTILLGMKMQQECYEIKNNSSYLVCTKDLYLKRSKEIQDGRNEILRLKKLESANEELNALLTQARTERDCAWKELDRIKGSAGNANSGKADVPQESEEFYRIRYEQLQSENEVLKKKLQEIESDNSYGVAMMQLNNEKAKLEENIRQKDNRIQSLLNSIKSLTEKSSSGEKSVSSESTTESDEAGVKQELAEARQRIEFLEGKLKIQETDVATVDSLRKELAESKGIIRELDARVKGYSKTVARNKSIELRSSKSRQTTAKAIKYIMQGKSMKEVVVALAENEDIHMKLNSLYRLICVTEDDSKEKLLSLMKEFPNEFEGVSKEAVIAWFNKLRAKKLHLISKDEITESYGDEALTVLTNSGITPDKCVEDHYSAEDVAEVIAKKVAEEETKVDEWGQTIEEA